MKDRRAGDSSGGLEYVDAKDNPSKGIWSLPQRALEPGLKSAPWIPPKEVGGRGSGDLKLGSIMADSALELPDGSEWGGAPWLPPFKGQHLSRQAEPRDQRLHLHPTDTASSVPLWTCS